MKTDGVNVMEYVVVFSVLSSNGQWRGALESPNTVWRLLYLFQFLSWI